MKIAIIGTGGVGGYFGGELARAGFDVTFLARGEHLAMLKKNGLTVKSILGDFYIKQVKATDKIQHIGQVDLIILGVKAWQIVEIRDELKSIMHNSTTILPLQNGVLAAEELAAAINKKNIVGGLCRIISKIESPGVINHFGVDPLVVFGELNKPDSERVQTIKAVFEQAEINAKVSADIESELWKKFIAICISGLLAVTKTTYGELMELKETRQMAIDLLNEIYNLSQKIGINIDRDFIAKAISLFDSLPYHSMPSLTRDVWEGKPSEIHYQNGTVVSLGKKYRMDTPINKFIYHCILPMELKARKNNRK